MKKRIAGIDSIRAVCALWVLFGHFGGPPVLVGIDKSIWLGRSINAVYNNFWNGPAAVIVFFIISGFCIHYSQAKAGKLYSIPSFYARRLVRILIPMIVAIATSVYFFGLNELPDLNNSVLWSLVCEVIYYLIYPLFLLLVSRGTSWNRIFLVSFVIALCIPLIDTSAKNYPSFSIYLNWLLGLPCWVLGCLIAERVTNNLAIPQFCLTSVGYTRSLVFFLTIILSVIRFHSPLGYPWTLNWFSIIAAYWFFCEISHFSNVTPFIWLEKIGVFSYSIYLTHVPLHGLANRLNLPNLGYLLNWFMLTTLILFGSLVFYMVIERPSHILAKMLGEYIESKRKKAEVELR